MAKKLTTASTLRVVNVDYGGRTPCTVEFLEITPAMAREFLQRNIAHNRPINTSQIQRLSGKMKVGRFLLSGDTIKFDINDNLNDGQHRLMACIDADVSFPTLVVRGLGLDVFPVLDLGKKRNAAQLLRGYGIPNANNVSAVSRWLCIVKAGGANKRPARSLDDLDIGDMAGRHPNIINSVNACSGARCTGRFGLMVCLHYIAHDLMGLSSEAEGWATAFRESKAAYPNDAAIAWREHCLRTRSAGATMDASMAYPNMITVFNYHMARQGVEGIWKMRKIGEVLIEGLDLELV